MPTLSEYTNVYNTALLILRSKGYQIWYDETAEMYCAEKNGWDFMAEAPVSLLGLIAIYEHKKPDQYREYWWREEGPDLYNGISKEKPLFDSVLEK